MSKLKKLTDEYLESLIEAQREDYQGNLQPFDAYKEKIFQNACQIATFHQESVGSGYHTLIEELKKKSPPVSRPLDEFLIKKENFVDTDWETVQERVGFSIEVLRDIYTVAINLFHEKKYEDARNLLSYLLFLNPYVVTFWIALGKVSEAEQDQSTALESYKLALIADPKDQLGYDNAIRCCIDLEKWDDAEVLIDSGIQVAGEPDSKLTAHLKKLKAYVERKQGGKS